MNINTEIDNEDTLLSSADDDWEKLLNQAETIRNTIKVYSGNPLDNLNWNKLLGSIYSKEKIATDNWEKIVQQILKQTKLQDLSNVKPRILEEEVVELPDKLPRNYEDFELCSIDLNDSYNGYIVSSSGRYDSSNFNFAPSIYLSNSLCDPTFIGIISYTNKYKLSKTFKESGIAVVSTGQTTMWVCDVDLPINNGDLITTSLIPGVGLKQIDDIMRNCTVAKATMYCDFEPKQMPKKKYPPRSFDEFGRPIYFFENELEPSYKMKYINLVGDEISFEEYSNAKSNVYRIAKICVKL